MLIDVSWPTDCFSGAMSSSDNYTIHPANQCQKEKMDTTSGEDAETSPLLPTATAYSATHTIETFGSANIGSLTNNTASSATQSVNGSGCANTYSPYNAQYVHSSFSTVTSSRVLNSTHANSLSASQAMSSPPTASNDSGSLLPPKVATTLLLVDSSSLPLPPLICSTNTSHHANQNGLSQTSSPLSSPPPSQSNFGSSLARGPSPSRLLHSPSSSHMSGKVLKEAMTEVTLVSSCSVYHLQKTVTLIYTRLGT